jgi:hypothetical protein
VGDIRDPAVDHEGQSADALFELGAGGDAGAAGVGEFGLSEQGDRIVAGEEDGEGAEGDLELLGYGLERFLRGLDKLEQLGSLGVGGDEVAAVVGHGETRAGR